MARWHVDASFAVHPMFCSHSRGTLLLSPEGGGIASGSIKQKLNIHSSTMAELVACDNFLSKIMWAKNFMEAQGIVLQSHLMQDNQSSILLAKKGRAALGKQTRAMNVRYFAIKDHIDSGQLQIFHLKTNKMVADFFTKPLQGRNFLEFRQLILGGFPDGKGDKISVVSVHRRQ